MLRSVIRCLLDDPHATVDFAPVDEQQAAMAVRLLEEGLREGAAAMRAAVLRTQETADCLSGDRLQVFAELIQNADDAGARRIRFVLRGADLVVAHDGRPVRLADVLLMGLPGLSGKAGDPDATGRFGIGLATVRALSRVWEVHSPPYRVRFDGISIGWAEEMASGVRRMGETVFRIPLDGDGNGGGGVSEGDVVAWFAAWDDASLLFLRHLREVVVEAADGRELCVLRLTWASSGGGSTVRMRVGASDHGVRIRRAETASGTAWRVFDTELPCPQGVLRRHKAGAATVPVAVALPVAATADGMVHAALPMAPIGVPVRAHAQFDPLVSRRDFVASAWNDAMVGLVADLWAAAVPAVLGGDGPTAWHLVPGESPAGTASGAVVPKAPVGSTALAESLRAALVERARGEVAERLRLACPDGVRRPVRELAVEERRLEGVLDSAQVARLAGAPERFPAACRDRAGRWRRVLADWRAAGRATRLPAEVTTRDALRLFEEPGLGGEQAIRLAAVAMHSGLDAELLGPAWVVAADGTRLPPPDAADGRVFVRRPGSSTAGRRRRGHADRLGIAVDLHPLHFADTTAARTVLAWLGDRGCVLDADDAPGLLRRIAAQGGAGGVLGRDGRTRDMQLLALRSAFGELGDADRRTLGPGVGRALRLRALDAEGRQSLASPAEVYLPAQLAADTRHPFADAALDMPGPRWLDPSYAGVLGETKADGPERTAFLRALGAADAPRLTVPPAGTGKAYATDRYTGPGLPADPAYGTPARTRELRRLGADHTLDDRDSPDLLAFAAAIAADPDRGRRRARVIALVHTLARAFGRRSALGVDAAYGYYGWHRKGRTAPLWIWRLRDIAWLERADGSPARPGELHLRTPASEALYGREDPGYLHPDIHRETAGVTNVLLALGLTGEPGVEALGTRLRALRARTPPGTGVSDALTGDAIAVYRALAVLLDAVPGDQRRADVERAFRQALPAREPLVLTDAGWRRPGEVLQGPSILGGYRTFVLPEPGLRPLWHALGVREPQAHDLADVLAEAAHDTDRPVEARLGVTLEALRRLAALLGAGAGAGADAGAGASAGASADLSKDVSAETSTTSSRDRIPAQLRDKLAALPLRVRGRWTTRRPVYAIDNRHLAEALGRVVPVWQPGGDLQQFAALVDAPDSALGITRVEPCDARVLDAHRATADANLTSAYRRAVARLQDTLVRDEPDAAAACTRWEWLAALDVRVLRDGVRIRLPIASDGTPAAVELAVDAHIDQVEDILYVASAAALESARGAGQAVAACFARERTRVGHIWRDVWESERESMYGSTRPTTRGLTPLPLAHQRDQAAAERLDRLVEARHKSADNPDDPDHPRHDEAHLHASSPAEAAHPSDAAAAPGPVPATAPAALRKSAPTPVAPPQLRPSGPPRRLIDVATLPEPTTITPGQLANGNGNGNGDSEANRARAAAKPTAPAASAAPGALPAPVTPTVPPQQHTGAPAYTPQDRETTAFELLRVVLARTGVELFDHRTQAGLGADAVDAREHFYEIKAHAGPEPREVTLTLAEFERAVVAGDRFSLVVAANLEQGTGVPRLRVITDPLRHLGVERAQQIRVTGLLDTADVAVVHEWRPTDDQP